MTAAAIYAKSRKTIDFLAPAGWLGRKEPLSAYARCLPLLLAALKWPGDYRQLCESLPHFPDRIDQVDFVNVMVNLDYDVEKTSIRLHHFDARLAPALFVPRLANDGQSSVLVLTGDEKSAVSVWDGSDDPPVELKRLSNIMGKLFVFRPLSVGEGQDKGTAEHRDESALRWFRHLTGRFNPVFRQALLTSFFINTLALAISLFIMVVYDKVIGSRSLDTLNFFTIGVAVAITIEALLRYLRAHSLAFFGVRIDAIVSAAIFKRLLFFAPRIVERSSTPAQVARMRDFDTVRQFFSGPLGANFIDLFYAFIFIIVIAIIGGPLAVIPVILAAAYALLALFMLPKIRAKTEAGLKANGQKQALLVETMEKIRAIKLHGFAGPWWKRYHEQSGITSATGFQTSFLTAIVAAIAYGLSVASGVATLAVGIWLVWRGQITAGALIASMKLTWRVLYPFQAVCNSMTRFRYLGWSIRQVHRLMQSPPEKSLLIRDESLKNIRGDVTFAGVGLRYTSEKGPVINGMSLDVRHGQIVAIAGPSGSGKSSLLKLVNGLYPPQMGAVRIDGMDIRQKDPLSLRKMISYLPQNVELYHGSIEQNLLMVNPRATRPELEEALERAGATEGIRCLPEGIEHFIGDYRSEQLPSSLAFQLSLARLYLRDSTIMLVDEFPPVVLNSETGRLFKTYLEAQRGRKTVLFVTDRKEYMETADMLIFLAGDGRVMAGDPPKLLETLNRM